MCTKENISAWVIRKRRNLPQDVLSGAKRSVYQYFGHLLLFLYLLMTGTGELPCPCNSLRGGSDAQDGLHITAFNYAGISNAVLPGSYIVVGVDRSTVEARLIAPHIVVRWR